ncbi:hypothetical protein ACIGG9_25995 [Pseudonocardia alni]
MLSPRRFVEPEQRVALASRCEDNARRYREVADVIADTRAALVGTGA